MDVLMADGVMKRLDLAINDKTGLLNIPHLTEAFTLTRSITIWGIFSFWYRRHWKKGCCWN